MVRLTIRSFGGSERVLQGCCLSQPMQPWRSHLETTDLNSTRMPKTGEVHPPRPTFYYNTILVKTNKRNLKKKVAPTGSDAAGVHFRLKVPCARRRRALSSVWFSFEGFDGRGSVAEPLATRKTRRPPTLSHTIQRHRLRPVVVSLSFQTDAGRDTTGVFFTNKTYPTPTLTVPPSLYEASW